MAGLEVKLMDVRQLKYSVKVIELKNVTGRKDAIKPWMAGKARSWQYAFGKVSGLDFPTPEASGFGI